MPLFLLRVFDFEELRMLGSHLGRRLDSTVSCIASSSSARGVEGGGVQRNVQLHPLAVEGAGLCCGDVRTWRREMHTLGAKSCVATVLEHSL